MKLRIAAAVLLAAPALALAQAAKPLPTKDAPKPAASPAREGPVAVVNGVTIPRQRAEFLVRQQTARGMPDSEQLRAQVREVLINNEVMLQEAVKSGANKRADVQAQIEQARLEIIVNSFINDYLTKNPVSEAEVQQEYERAKQQTGSTEYKARHILVQSEDEAKRILGEIRKGAKFEEQAQKHSVDSTKEKGGDLDWNVPGIFDKSFADAMVKLEKGKMTDAPVRTRFGYHLIQLDDVRPVRIPPLTEVKSRIQQRLVQVKIDQLVRDLRAKAKIE